MLSSKVFELPNKMEILEEEPRLSNKEPILARKLQLKLLKHTNIKKSQYMTPRTHNDPNNDPFRCKP